MPLSKIQITALSKAIVGYDFPCVLKDFSTDLKIPGLTMADVEAQIYASLTSGNITSVREGLANVLYWGFAQMGGLADVRSGVFLDRVKNAQLIAAVKLFAHKSRPSLLSIKALNLPQFSAISFVSKIRMFLDPAGSATLDKQILKIKFALPGTVLDQVVAAPQDTAIRLTVANSAAYEAWCQRLEVIRKTYFPSCRVVDIERGLFHLVQTGQVPFAAALLRDG